MWMGRSVVMRGMARAGGSGGGSGADRGRSACIRCVCVSHAHRDRPAGWVLCEEQRSWCIGDRLLHNETDRDSRHRVCTLLTLTFVLCYVYTGSVFLVLRTYPQTRAFTPLRPIDYSL